MCRECVHAWVGCVWAYVGGGFGGVGVGWGRDLWLYLAMRGGGRICWCCWQPPRWQKCKLHTSLPYAVLKGPHSKELSLPLKKASDMCPYFGPEILAPAPCLQVLARIAAQHNRRPLPELRQDKHGLRLPPEVDCLLAPNYQLQVRRRPFCPQGGRLRPQGERGGVYTPYYCICGWWVGGWEGGWVGGREGGWWAGMGGGGGGAGGDGWVIERGGQLLCPYCSVQATTAVGRSIGNGSKAAAGRAV